MSILTYFAKKKVLITGNTGFKGAWLTLWLLELGAQVAGFSIDIPTQPALYDLLQLEKNIKQYWGDIRRLDMITDAVADFKPDIIFHLAAQPIVKEAYRDPVKTFETNALGMVNLLDTIRHNKHIKTAVLITSDKCYENVEWPYGYRETDHLGGKDPYSASKGCAELVAHSFWHSYFKNQEQGPLFATTRAGNVIGGGDWAEARLVPDIIRAWYQDEDLVLRNPNATRPWQHVLEPVSGYLCLATALASCQAQTLAGTAFNFGPREDTTKTVEQLVQQFAQYWPKAKWHFEADNAMKEASLLKLDCSKAQQQLNWRATLDFHQTIMFTAKWYQQYQSGAIRDFTIEQIHTYTTLARERGIAWAI